jgi:hypothetical protein
MRLAHIQPSNALSHSLTERETDRFVHLSHCSHAAFLWFMPLQFVIPARAREYEIMI